MLTVLDVHTMRGASSEASSQAELEKRPAISADVNPVIIESVMLIVALVALNHPGNLREAPLRRDRELPAFRVRARWRYGSMASVTVVTTELSRTRDPVTTKEYPMWLMSFANRSPPSTRVRLPAAATVIVPSTVNIPVHVWAVLTVQSPVITPPTS